MGFNQGNQETQPSEIVVTRLSWNKKLQVSGPTPLRNLVESPLEEFLFIEDEDGRYFLLIPYIEENQEASRLLAEIICNSLNKTVVEHAEDQNNNGNRPG